MRWHSSLYLSWCSATENREPRANLLIGPSPERACSVDIVRTTSITSHRDSFLIWGEEDRTEMALETRNQRSWLGISTFLPHDHSSVHPFHHLLLKPSTKTTLYLSATGSGSPPPQALQIYAEAVWHFWEKVDEDQHLSQLLSFSRAGVPYHPVQRKIQPMNNFTLWTTSHKNPSQGHFQMFSPTNTPYLLPFSCTTSHLLLLVQPNLGNGTFCWVGLFGIFT